MLTREISEQGTTDRTPDEVADVTKFVIGNAVVLIEMPVEKLVKLAGGLPAENFDRRFLPVAERHLGNRGGHGVSAVNTGMSTIGNNSLRLTICYQFSARPPTLPGRPSYAAWRGGVTPSASLAAEAPALEFPGNSLG